MSKAKTQERTPVGGVGAAGGWEDGYPRARRGWHTRAQEWKERLWQEVKSKQSDSEVGKEEVSTGPLVLPQIWLNGCPPQGQGSEGG